MIDDTASTHGATRTDVVDIVEPLRRYVRAHTFQPADTDDVVQETLTRVLELGQPLAPDSALAYALVTARHLIADRARDSDRHRRNAHRLIDLTQPERPDDALLEQEDGQALREALAAVPAAQREVLLAHVLEKEPIDAIAAQTGKSDGSLAAQLARTRAKLRLDYVMALRGVTLPTARCRPILLTLSAGDTRRQTALRAGEHLLTCETCATLSRPLLQRRSALAALLPWLGLGPLLALLRKVFAHRPVQVTAAASVVAAAGVGAAMWASAPSPAAARSEPVPVVAAARTTAAPDGRLIRVDNQQPLTASSGQLAELDGRAVSGRDMKVLAVPADEGFWIANGEDDRVWVELRTGGPESRVHIKVGDRVSFSGRIVIHSKGFAADAGVAPGEDAKLLTREGAHVSVAVGQLQLNAP